MQKGKLYLIPSSIRDLPLIKELNSEAMDIVSKLNIFVIETPKIGRSHLRDIPDFKVFEKTFIELNENSKVQEVTEEVFKHIEDGHDVGVMSDAGLPCVGDMGAPLVSEMQKRDVEIIPLSIPSAIIATLMASGLNGQNFAFVGYLPKISDIRAKAIKNVEQRSIDLRQTQIFIETPYKSQYIYEDILNTCKPTTKLCIGAGVGKENGYVKTKSISDWKSSKANLKGSRVVFLIQA